MDPPKINTTNDATTWAVEGQHRPPRCYGTGNCRREEQLRTACEARIPDRYDATGEMGLALPLQVLEYQCFRPPYSI
jgi:hypothetical protein